MICSGMVNRSYGSAQCNTKIKCVNTNLVLKLTMNGTVPLLPFEISWRVQDFSGPGSSVGIATGYGLDGPGIESR